MKAVIGLFLAFGIGIVCRLSGIPLPAPPAMVGALLVLAMTTGYVLMNGIASRRESRSARRDRASDREFPGRVKPS